MFIVEPSMREQLLREPLRLRMPPRKRKKCKVPPRPELQVGVKETPTKYAKPQGGELKLRFQTRIPTAVSSERDLHGL